MYSTLFILNDRGITAVLPWCCVCCTAVVSACFVETFTCVCDVILVDCPFVAGALLHGNSVVAVSTYWALPIKVSVMMFSPCVFCVLPCVTSTFTVSKLARIIKQASRVGGCERVFTPVR